LSLLAGRPGGEFASAAVSMSCPQGPSVSACTAGWTQSLSGGCTSLKAVPSGPKAGDQAEKVRTRLLHQVDQKRNPRTRATVGQLLDRWLQVLDVDVDQTDLRRLHPQVHPARARIATADGSTSKPWTPFHAELRRCREHCDGRPGPPASGPSGTDHGGTVMTRSRGSTALLRACPRDAPPRTRSAR